MDRACVHSILAVLLIAVHSSMAFPSNIHENMTRIERFAVFGSEDSVPEYEVFPISLPGARSRRKADKNINLKLEVGGKELILDLKPTMGYLATKYTPVFVARSDKRAYNKIRYDPLPKAMSDIGKFKMYHDVKNEAAITIFEDPSEGSVMLGIVTAHYAIASLPKRLMGELLKEGKYLQETWVREKRSIISDAEGDKGYYVIFKTPTALNDVKSSSLVDSDNLRREKRAKNKGGKISKAIPKQKIPKAIPEAIYPEILIVLDHTLDHYSTQNPTLVLRHTLTFWNAVDLMYRTLDKPNVYLNIAGIIFAEDRTVMPHIYEPREYGIDASPTVLEMGKYFYKEQVRFPMNRYDMVIAMTRFDLYVYKYGFYNFVNGYRAPNTPACSSSREVSKTKTVGNTGIVTHIAPNVGIRTAAEITAYLLGAKHAAINAVAPDCASPELHDIIISYDDLNKMQLSNCSRRDFSDYFSSKKSVCLRNKPLWRKQVGEVLPGRWLTLDGQCQNEGYAKACKLKKSSTCAAKGCQRKGSSSCVRSKRTPLPGSTCGTKMHCSAKKKCVRD